MSERSLVSQVKPSEQLRELRQQFATAKVELQQAERALAEEQAAVNAFRMHCRLRLDDLVDAVLESYTLKQTLIAELQLLQLQRGKMAFDADDSHPFWQDVDDADDDPLLTVDGAGERIPYQLPNDKASEKRLYRSLVKKFHPDLVDGVVAQAYATSMMAAVNAAYEARDMQTLYDLAGELDPHQREELAHIESKAVRQMRQKLLKCQRRRRRLARQLQALRAEDTAHLWRKAQVLEQMGERRENWWDEMRVSLQESHGRLQREISQLQVLIDEVDGTNKMDEIISEE